jgi:hypothetical protein
MREELRSLVWSKERAAAWMAKAGVIRGVNYVPAYCHSYIEMWHHYDAVRIRREVGWAKAIGINSFRIFVASCQWETCRGTVAENLDRFLDLCRDMGITVMLTLQPNLYSAPGFALGDGEDPFEISFSAGRHDKGWRYKGTASGLTHWAEKKEAVGNFVTDIVSRYGGDERVTFWDLYNEPWPDCLDILETVFMRARAAAPMQPLSSCWLSQDISDITTFHCYERPGAKANVQDSGCTFTPFDEELARAEATGRPMLCTECLARSFGNELAAFLPYYRARKVAFTYGGCAREARNIIFPGTGRWAARNRPDGSTACFTPTARRMMRRNCASSGSLRFERQKVRWIAIDDVASITSPLALCTWKPFPRISIPLMFSLDSVPPRKRRAFARIPRSVLADTQRDTVTSRTSPDISLPITMAPRCD